MNINKDIRDADVLGHWKHEITHINYAFEKKKILLCF